MARARRRWGWNSWNRFGCDIDEATVRAMADAMSTSGMQEAGYQYVVVDDCWHGERDANGFIHENREKFPSGMKALADYIHSKGLKFGIYSDAGSKTCGGRPGSQGHEYQDALTYARWGVDYLKCDWCSTGVRNAEDAYALMADALKAAGPPIVLAIYEWGNNRPGEWRRRSAISGARPATFAMRAAGATVGRSASSTSTSLYGPMPAPAAGTTPACSKSAMAA